jgi:hypothetical protein
VKYYLVKEIQTCYVEYVVRAETVTKAKAKAKVIDQDVVELLNCPTFIKTNSYEAEEIKGKEAGDPVVVRAIKDIELNYAPDEPEPPKKKRKRRNKNDIDELVEMINGS